MGEVAGAEEHGHGEREYARTPQQDTFPGARVGRVSWGYLSRG